MAFRDSSKYEVTITSAANDPSDRLIVTGSGSSIRIALQRAAAKLAPSVRYTSADKPLTVQVYKGR